jgi:hypothetical protein
MSNEKSYAVTLKMSMSEWGTFQSLRLLKGTSKLDENVLTQINLALQTTLVPSTTAKPTVVIGDDAERKVMHHLLLISLKNMDFNVVDTSSMTGHGDIMVIHCSKRICIEVKCYSKPVPVKEIEKYHSSIAMSEYDAGIMIQMDPCGYATSAAIQSPIHLTNDNGKPSAYLTSPDLDMIYPVISLLINQCKLDPSDNKNELDEKKKKLMQVNDNVMNIRNSIIAQKKLISKMETMVDEIIKLSIE